MNLEKMFKLSENSTTIKTELIAGITTFLTMAYIIAVNPAILSTKGTGMSYAGVLTATILVSSISSILMGLFANLPYALAPGMGINAFFTYTLVLGKGVNWQTALGAVFISGIIFILLSIFKVRELIVFAIPKTIRLGVAGGIGLFLCFIGFKNAGFIVASPATMVSFGGFSPNVIIFTIGFIVTVLLLSKKVRGALTIGILINTLIAFTIGRVFSEKILVNMPNSIFASPDFSTTFLKLDVMGALKPALFGAIFTLLFTDMFDSISTFLGVAQVANLNDKDGNPKNLRSALLVDAISTTISGLFGSSSGTTYIESASGVEEGGRTGLTSIVTGILFIPFLFIAPLVGMIPEVATSPALVIVGYYMMKSVKNIDFDDVLEGIPAYLAFILIPLTFSITQGISWSLITYLLLKIMSGKREKIPFMLYIIVAFAILALVLS
jgi:AGZA family xanthine/uracil permease-like MFS transporter